MNEAGRELARQLAQKQYSSIEYRNKLVRIQNMSCVCHCSGEIDMSTLLYFSVNDLPLGQGDYVLILFSEISQNSPEQQEGRDVYGRMYTYAIIEQAATEIFTGHHTFYSCEMDGRLVFLVHFPFGILPDPTIVDFLDISCREVSERCRAAYDLDVVSYISHPIDDIHFISGVYNRLFENATFNLYLELEPEDPVFHPPETKPSLWADFSSRIQDYAMTLLSDIVNGRDPHDRATQILRELVATHPLNVDILKQLLVLFMECLYSTAQDLGIRIKAEEERLDDFRAVFDSLHFRTAETRLHQILDELQTVYAQTGAKTVLHQLDDILEYIAANLSDPDLSVERCATVAHCSTSAVNKVFRRQLDTSVARYIRQARLKKAYQLLQAGTPVGQTCVLCGFGSTETFHRVFREEYGVTPGQVRKVT